jgi:hypothetical protein
VLIEGMQVQAKIYDEWMEVMSDYSTVFSEGRRVNEHSYSGGGGGVAGAGVGAEEDGRDASNATVSDRRPKN